MSDQQKEKKQREGKGHSVNGYVSDYCVVDLETTSNILNIAEIIEISALKVRNGNITDEFSTLVNPQCHIPEEATEKNHITDDMVADAPLLDDVIDDFMVFVGNDIILGYNNASYDMLIIYDKLIKLRGIPFTNDYLDIFSAVRRLFKDMPTQSLEAVSEHYHFDNTGEHRALKDCYLTKDCYDAMYNEFGDTVFRKSESDRHHYQIHYSDDTLALQEIQALLRNITSVGKASEEDFNSLMHWMDKNIALKDTYPFDHIYPSLQTVLEDRTDKQTVLNELEKLHEEYVDPVNSHSYQGKIDSLEGKHIVTTGDFAYGEKPKVYALIERAGGIVDKNLTLNTDYVIVGAYGSKAWKAGSYGEKVEKAMRFNSKKHRDIKIVKEYDFIPAAEALVNAK